MIIHMYVGNTIKTVAWNVILITPFKMHYSRFYSITSCERGLIWGCKTVRHVACDIVYSVSFYLRRLIGEKYTENSKSFWPCMAGKKPQQIRIATVDAKGIQGGVLKGHKATLKVLHVTNNVQLLVSVLSQVEDPSPSQGIYR